jgi:hypothetical protein
MNLKIIFKRLVLLDLSLFILIIVTIFFQSEKVIKFTENLDELSNVFLTLAGIWLLAYFVNLFLLYKFKSIGKQMYPFIYIIALVLALLGGPVVLDPWTYVLDGIEMSVAGALLVLLYFSPIKKEFEK